MEEKKLATSPFKHKLLNVCVFIFVAVVTTVALMAFFVASFSGAENATSNGYSIASIYILCMLLAAPTLKVFLDKVESRTMKIVNVAGIIAIFAAILVMTVAICLGLAFPAMMA